MRQWYRGVGLGKEEWQRLEENTGKYGQGGETRQMRIRETGREDRNEWVRE